MSQRPSTELRQDMLTGRSVIVAAHRSERPQHSAVHNAVAHEQYDPFLEGNEKDTPAESLALRQVDSQADQPGWLLRVVPNRYPAVTQTGHSENQQASEGFPSSAACGFHEVVIECPDRRTRLADLSVVEVTRILTAWQVRFNVLSAEPDVDTVNIFRNEGALAGASLPHCHSQILATQRVPSAIPHPHNVGTASRYSQWMKQELTSRDRIITEDQQLVVVCPFASRVAWQVRICPNVCSGQPPIPFGEVSVSSLQTVAAKLLSVVTALQRLLGELSYNLLLRLPPTAEPNAFPWLLDVVPRTGQFAGFELLTDTDIITTAPETAATQLRDVVEWTKADGNEESLWPPDYQWV